jgi:mRNA interferase MazF
MTSRARAYPSRVPCLFQGKAGQIVLDQIRAVDKTRLIRRLGEIEESAQVAILDVLARIFAK